MKSLWKRAVSLLLTLSMMLPLVPVSAFADSAFDATAPIYPDHFSEEGLSFELGNNTLMPANFETGTTGVLTEPYQKDATGKIDLWVTSSNMVANNEDDGSVIPYVYDEAGNRWYLKEIGWADRTALNNKQTGTIMDAAAIKAAAQAKDKTCYVVDPATKINVGPRGISYRSDKGVKIAQAYIICYYWTTDAPETWDVAGYTPTYHDIEYSTGVPDELGNKFSVYRIKKDGAIEIGDIPEITREAFENEIVRIGKVDGKIDGKNVTVKDGLNFIIAKNTDYKGYLAFDRDNDLYYEFVGWKVTGSPNGAVYEVGDILKPVNYQVDGEEVVAFALQEDDGLTETNDVPATVAEDGAITLTGVWKKIVLKDSFEGAPEFLLLAEDDNTAQIVQWTNDNEANATTGEITLDEDDTLYYRATVYMTDEVAAALESKTMWSKDFAVFDITVDVDSSLVIDEDSIDTEGNVTAEFVCPFLEPTAVLVDNTEISYTSEPTSILVNNVKTKKHTIKVAAKDITDAEGAIKPFTIQVKWIIEGGGNHSAQSLMQPMTLTSFGLALKTGTDGKVENPDLTLSTSGEVNGTIDFSKTNARVPDQAASALLNTKGDWQKYFGGNGSDPTALVNASRYIRRLDKNNAQLTANVVTAKYGEPAPETYTVTLVTNGGTIAEGKNVTEYTVGVGAVLPTADEIELEGYTFQGWYTDEMYSDEEPIRAIGADETGHKTYYAKWEEKQNERSYSVFLIKNGGTFAEGKQLTQYTAGVETPLPTAEDITREGYTFKGWYADEELTDGSYKFIDAAATGCKVFFAKWEPVPVTPSEPAQSGSDDGTAALIGAGVVLAGGAAALAYLYRDALPIWLFTGVVKLDDEDGTPVPNATVALYQDGEEVKTVTTNDDGYFTTRVPKGDYEVVVTWERDGVQYTTTTQATVDQVAGDIRPQEIILALDQLPEGMLP